MADKSDPNWLKRQRPDYVQDRSGVDISDHSPVVGSDPEDLPQEGVDKTVIAPDPEKVREADRQRTTRKD